MIPSSIFSELLVRIMVELSVFDDIRRFNIGCILRVFGAAKRFDDPEDELNSTKSDVFHKFHDHTLYISK